MLTLAGLLIFLAAVAWLAPPGREDSDRPVYETAASQLIIPGCDQLHCFRVLVPWVLGRMPGPSLLKWKAYAVACTAAAAIVVMLLCSAWGLSRPAGRFAAAASATGFGSMYALYDPFTADPLMFLAGPLLLWLLALEYLAPAGIMAALLVAGKEFAVVPVYVHAAAQWIGGRRAAALRAAAIAAAVFAVWVALQVWLRSSYNYSFGVNPSVQPLSGGYLWYWLKSLPPAVAAFALVAEFGVLWILAPAGWRYAPAPLKQATMASVPAAAVLFYFQQPDRALWNFHFVMTPLAALVLSRVPVLLASATLAAFALANLRVGAQLSFVPASRATLTLSLVLGAACCVWLWRRQESIA